MAGARAPLEETTVEPDPLAQFGRWYDEAADAVRMPEAMAVASADPIGRPSLRMVLLKEWGAEGFVFYTNHESRKGRELAANPYAALLFYWEPLGRQVRIEGTAAQLDDAESDAYFATRARGSQLGAQASRQSRPVADRGSLDAEVHGAQERFAGRSVPRPPWWGGWRVRPHSFEFWQQREDRMHDRLLFTPDGTGWRITRLQP